MQYESGTVACGMYPTSTCYFLFLMTMPCCLLNQHSNMPESLQHQSTVIPNFNESIQNDCETLAFLDKWHAQRVHFHIKCWGWSIIWSPTHLQPSSPTHNRISSWSGRPGGEHFQIKCCDGASLGTPPTTATLRLPGGHSTVGGASSTFLMITSKHPLDKLPFSKSTILVNIESWSHPLDRHPLGENHPLSCKSTL